MNKLLSVIVPSYNHDKYIETCVRSIWDQADTDIEIIVIDDESTDSSITILENLQKISPMPMYIYTQKNSGPVISVNRGIELAKGDYCCFIASDDFYLSNSLKNVILFFKNNPQIKVVFADGYQIVNNKIHKRMNRKFEFKILGSSLKNIQFYLKNTDSFSIHMHAMMIKTNLLREIGGFDIECKLEDWPFLIRLFDHLNDGEYATVEYFTYGYRIHGKNTIHNPEIMYNLLLPVVKKYFTEPRKSTVLCNISIKYGLFLLWRGQFKKSYSLFVNAINFKGYYLFIIKLIYFIVWAASNRLFYIVKKLLN